MSKRKGKFDIAIEGGDNSRKSFLEVQEQMGSRAQVGGFVFGRYRIISSMK